MRTEDLRTEYNSLKVQYENLQISFNDLSKLEYNISSGHEEINQIRSAHNIEITKY